MERRINSIGIHLGQSEFCVSVRAGTAAIYLHGTTEEIRAFGSEIIEAADAYDLKQARAAAVPDNEFARVCWRNPRTGNAEYGMPLPIAVAKDALRHGSNLYPELKHWIELVDPASEVKA